MGFIGVGMAKEKVKVDTDFVMKVRKLVEICGTGRKTAKYCGITPELISTIKNGRTKLLYKNVYERIARLFGKNLEEIENLEKELKIAKDLKAAENQKIISKNQENMLAMDKRVNGITIGKRYRAEFSQNQKEAKFKVSNVIYGEVIEIYKRFFLVQTKNFKTTVLKKEVRSGIVTMKELGN